MFQGGHSIPVVGHADIRGRRQVTDSPDFSCAHRLWVGFIVHRSEKATQPLGGPRRLPVPTCKTEAMDLVLDAEEIRILGSLLEKEITTPEYYPLSVNGLLNACNQKSNRDPVVHLDEDGLERALYTLRDKGLLLIITGAGSRVPKY